MAGLANVTLVHFDIMQNELRHWCVIQTLNETRLAATTEVSTGELWPSLAVTGNKITYSWKHQKDNFRDEDNRNKHRDISFSTCVDCRKFKCDLKKHTATLSKTKKNFKILYLSGAEATRSLTVINQSCHQIRMSNLSDSAKYPNILRIKKF